jgi:hypothetical protein
MRQDNPISRVTINTLDDLGLIPNKGRNFSLYHHVQTGMRVNPASYPVGTSGALSPERKHPKCEADQSSPCIANLKNG